MATDSVEEATQELLAILPLLNRIVAAEVCCKAGKETTMPQFRVLAHLAAEPMTLSALAKKRRVSLQSMSELVQTLVSRGWITREPDPHDRRQLLLQLTDYGRIHYERTHTRSLQRLAPLLSQLRDKELAAVRIALRALRRVLIVEENDEDNERTPTTAPTL